MKDNKERRSFGAVRAVILVIALGVFVYSGYQLWSIFSVYKKAGDEYSSLAGDFTHAAEDDGDVSPAAAPPSDTSAGDKTSGASPAESGPSAAPEAGDTAGGNAAAGDTAGGNDAAGNEDTQAGGFAAKPREPVVLSGAASGIGPPAGEAAQAADRAADQPEIDYNRYVRPNTTGLYEDAEPPITVDWDELKAINRDIVGWICVDALPTINYPVCRGEDNEFYLHHTFRKEYLFAGSIFMDSMNSGDFSDPNTVVYGHNMKNGSMFNTLKELNSQEKYDESPYFWILTPKGDYRYHIFSVTTAGTTSQAYLLYRFNGEELLGWARDMKNRSNVKNDVSLKASDKIVSLSTCTQDSGVRCLVLGKCVTTSRPVKKVVIPTPTPVPTQEPVPDLFDDGWELWDDGDYEEEYTDDGFDDIEIYGEDYQEEYLPEDAGGDGEIFFE